MVSQIQIHRRLQDHLRPAPSSLLQQELARISILPKVAHQPGLLHGKNDNGNDERDEYLNANAYTE